MRPCDVTSPITAADAAALRARHTARGSTDADRLLRYRIAIDNRRALEAERGLPIGALAGGAL